jgi:hypothetical protein
MKQKYILRARCIPIGFLQTNSHVAVVDLRVSNQEIGSVSSSV